MLLKKEGFPDESELVICTVTNIQFNSVFARLDEYGKSGMIHISEISPGRIRNIRDYVKEGKRIVCVVLRINKERGHIDLSLRRVNKVQHRKKIEQMKKEQKSEKILELVAKDNKLDIRSFYKEIMDKIEYEYLSDFFDEVIAGNADIASLKLKKPVAEQLEELVRQRIRLPTVTIEGVYTIHLFDPDGVEKIRKALVKADSVSDDASIIYLGAGKYEIRVVAGDYKTAEKILKNITSTIDKSLKNVKGTVEFKRKD